MGFEDFKEHPLWWSHVEFISNNMEAPEEYIHQHSKQYQSIKKRMDQIRPLLFKNMPYDMEDFYFEEIIPWKMKLDEYYWVRGLRAFFSGEPITDDSLEREPSSLEIDELDLEVKLKFNELKKKLPKDRWELADIFFSLDRQIIFDSRWYIFASGYLWAMEAAKAVNLNGVTERLENIQSLNQLLT